MKLTLGLSAMLAGVVLFGATSASAGIVTTLTTSKSSIYAGEAVDLTMEINSTVCDGAAVDFKDTTGSPVSLCTASLVASGSHSTATCPTSAINVVGTRTLRADVTSGTCSSFFATKTITVTAAPATVPTTSEWTLWGLTGLLLIGGGVFASRRFRATAG